MPIQQTTEFAATSPEVTRAVVQNLRTSDRRYKILEAVYGGGSRPKDARALAAKTGLTEVAVLQLATPMANMQFFEQVKHDGRVAFKKYPHINAVNRHPRAAKKSAPVQTKSVPVGQVDKLRDDGHEDLPHEAHGRAPHEKGSPKQHTTSLFVTPRKTKVLSLGL